MIAKTASLNQLKKLDKLYNAAILGSDPDLPRYYSRLAVIELGGWIEECMDDLARCHPRRKKLRTSEGRNYVDNIVKDNHGFEYNRNFRRMMKKIVGIVILEKTEQKMNIIRKQALESSLTVLYPERNEHAHIPIKTAPNFTTPSVCIAHFNQIYDGLQEFEKQLKRI